MLILSGIAGFVLAWLLAARRQAQSLRKAQALHELAERILAAASDTDILQLLAARGPEIFGPCEYKLYRHQRGTNSLDRVRTAAEPGSERIELGVPSAHADVFAGGEAKGGIHPLGTLGVFQMSAAGEPGLVQHLAAVIAAALKVQDQQLVREQMRRSEQLAMAGQLISAIANELRDPLNEVRMQAEGLLERQLDSLTAHDVRRIAEQATQAGDTVARLVEFARTDRTEVATFELNALLHGLVHFRDAECRTRGIELRTHFSREPIYVEGVRAQLEEAFLQLFFHAEQTAREITVATQLAGGNAVVLFEYANPDAAPDLALGRSLLQAHGGDLTVGGDGIQLQLPAVPPPTPRVLPVMVAAQHLTVLLIEPDEPARRRLLTALSERGHRVVPISSAEEGLDLVRRIRFDLAFCSSRLPGLKWVDFLEAARPQIGSFVLLTEGFDASLRGSDALLLRKPVDAGELGSLLASLAQPVTVP